MPKKGMKPKILLTFTFSVSYQLELEIFCFELVRIFYLFYFLSCVAVLPQNIKPDSAMFQLDDVSYLWSESNSSVPNNRIWPLRFWCGLLIKTSPHPSPQKKNQKAKQKKQPTNKIHLTKSNPFS